MNAIEKYRPQWFNVKPAGVNEEPFDVPFSFTFDADGTTHTDLPIQMDNEECIIRGIFFNTLPPVIIGVLTQNAPYFLMRLRDTFGNPTSDAPTFNCGGWANPSGAGCGFPIEMEMPCSPGGVVLADLQIISLADGISPVPSVTVSGALRCVRRRKC